MKLALIASAAALALSSISPWLIGAARVAAALGGPGNATGTTGMGWGAAGAAAAAGNGSGRTPSAPNDATGLLDNNSPSTGADNSGSSSNLGRH